MTPEELLRPRYKVIADYPACPYEIGTVLMPDEEGELYSTVAGYSRSVVKVMEGKTGNYPHLFKKLEWWEERKPEEMPEYVKSIQQEYSFGVKVGTVIRVKEWVNICDAMYVIQSRNREYHASCFVPATLADYQQYINQKEKQ